jgi:hypothetical protein
MAIDDSTCKCGNLGGCSNYLSLLEKFTRINRENVSAGYALGQQETIELFARASAAVLTPDQLGAVMAELYKLTSTKEKQNHE